MQFLILGAGYAGVRTALGLDVLLPKTSPAQVTLVDQNPYHQIIQILHKTATNGVAPADTIVDLEHIFYHRRVKLVQGHISSLDPLKQCVTLADGSTLTYDRLVVALGARTHYSGVPGAAEHTFPLHAYTEAVRLRDHIRACFVQAAQISDPVEQRILLTFTIVGGGYTGCQFAGELAEWVDELARETGAPRKEVRIALLDRHETLLSQFKEWATREAARVLDERGVSVYLHTPVERVEPRALYVSNNRMIRTATIIWAGGIHAPPFLEAAGLPTDEMGRVKVDRYLRVANQGAIFALGDCAHITDSGGALVPSAASYAMRQGEHLAQALVDAYEGRAPRSYDPLHLGELVSLGHDHAVGNPLGMPISGQAVLLLKKGIESWYRSTLE